MPIPLKNAWSRLVIRAPMDWAVISSPVSRPIIPAMTRPAAKVSRFSRTHGRAIFQIVRSISDRCGCFSRGFNCTVALPPLKIYYRIYLRIHFEEQIIHPLPAAPRFARGERTGRSGGAAPLKYRHLGKGGGCPAAGSPWPAVRPGPAGRRRSPGAPHRDSRGGLPARCSPPVCGAGHRPQDGSA